MRVKDRLNQTELAKRWKVSPSSVSIWLAGKGMPDRSQIRRIAADCRVDPGWLDYGPPKSLELPEEEEGEYPLPTPTKRQRKVNG